MLGSRPIQLETPAAKIVALVAACVFAVWWLVAACVLAVWWSMGITRSLWASRISDATHPYAIRFKGGTVLFFTPAIGWFLENSLWICFVLLCVSILIEFVARRRQRPADV
jgi:uncharacterized membrane protein